jgi:dTDP-4-amino-4,6-dideoxygalactose transaminase
MPEQLAVDGGTPIRKKPWPKWPVHDENEVEGLRRVVETGNWGGFPSPNVEAAQFAADFAAYQGAKFGNCTASGTTALEVALKAAGVGPGDEVIMPALTFVATAASALYMGAVPVFADVDPDTWCLEPGEAARAITEKTKVILPVHLGSRFVDMDAIMELARAKDLRVVEDCAHMHGGFWNGKGAGSLGDLGAFSFQNTKLMTSGEGGIVLTSDEELDARCHAYIDCGRLRPEDKPAEAQGVFGWNYRITEFQAAVLRAQLERLPEQVQHREANKARLAEVIDGIDGLSILKLDERITQPSGYGYYFRYHPDQFGGKPRDKFMVALRHEGLLCYGAFYEAVYKDKLFAWQDTGVDYDYSNVHCPNAERAAYEQSIWIPHELFLGDDADIDDIIAILEKVTETYRR